jgi:hypothetical protein
MSATDASWPDAPADFTELEVVEQRDASGIAHASLDQIQRDLHRAGRQELGISDSEAPAHREALLRLLLGWVKYDKEEVHGYAQAMSGIGAVLLVADHHDVPLAFRHFAQLMKALPFGFYDDGLRGCRVEVRALWLLACSRWPKLVPLLRLRESLELVSMQWFLSQWVGVLHQDDCLAVWRRMASTTSSSSSSSSPAPSNAPPADASLRIGLAILEPSLPELVEAAEADAEEASAMEYDEEAEGSGSVYSYTALQSAVSRAAAFYTEKATPGRGSGLTAAAFDALQLSAEAVRSARATACTELEAEAAEEAQRKAARRAKAAAADSRVQSSETATSGTRGGAGTTGGHLDLISTMRILFRGALVLVLVVVVVVVASSTGDHTMSAALLCVMGIFSVGILCVVSHRCQKVQLLLRRAVGQSRAIRSFRASFLGTAPLARLDDAAAGEAPTEPVTCKL